MGLDLRLLPYDADSGDFAFSHTVLSCEGDGALFDSILALEKQRGRQVVEGFTSFVAMGDDTCEETHYGKTTETPYGESLREVEVKEILPLFDGVKGKNAAIRAYLRELPDRTRIALFWH